MPIGYLDFDIEIRAGSGQEYLVVARSSQGEAYSTFLPLFGVQTFQQRLSELVPQLRAPDQSAVQAFGRMLFQAIFSGDIWTHYELAQRASAQEQKGLRLRLQVQPPELSLVPWELLFDPQRGEFVVLSRETPLVHYLDVPEPPAPLAVSPPLRILALSVSPSDMPPLKLDRERERLEQALAPLRERGLMELHWLAGSTWADLQQATWSGPWHVFHFIGHGEFDTERGEGCIIISDADNRAYRFSATQLARLLGDHAPLRLALLNACEGAMGSSDSLFSSVGGALVRRRVPAVVAMQYAISDRAAMTFARTFYGAVAHGMRLEAAMTEARKAVSMGVSGAEWATPVLYLRATDGFLFDLPSATPEPVPQAEPTTTVQPSPTPTPAEPPHNLPADLTPLIGRTKELSDISALLLRPDVRLVTLVGPAGCGKSRLGLEVATRLRDQFPDGTFLVRLASVNDPDLVAATIAATLNVNESGSEPLIDLLKAYLQERHMLLLIDNFEQLLDEAPLLPDLLAAAPNLHLLVTSRAALRVSGEYEFAVAALELPAANRPMTPEGLLKYTAVELFVERARAVRPAFALTAENAAAVVQICAHLDGLPLAIELAAARIKLLNPQAIVQRLDTSLKLLTGGARDLPERQQTLRNAIEWSYNLLEPSERQLLAQLGVFAGGCTIEAVEYLCNATGDVEIDLFDGLATLVDNSLLRQQEDAQGEPRFSLLRVMREFALEQLEQSTTANVLRQAHAFFYRDLVEQAEPELTGDEQERWIERLNIEYDNLRAAMGWASKADTETALRMGGALRHFWWARGLYTEGLHWIEQALAAPSATDPALADPRAKSLLVAGLFHSGQGNQQKAEQLLQESLQLSRQLDDTLSMARVLNMLGVIAYEQNDYKRARQFYADGLEILRSLNHTAGIAAILNNIGAVAFVQGDYDAAAQFYEESRAIETQENNLFGIALCLSNLGEVTLRRGKPNEAARFFRESLVLSQQIEAQEQIAYCLEGLAGVAEVQGYLERAARFWGAAYALRQTIPAPLPPPDLESIAFAIDVASAQHGDDHWQAAWNLGLSMPLERIIAEALEEA